MVHCFPSGHAATPAVASVIPDTILAPHTVPLSLSVPPTPTDSALSSLTVRLLGAPPSVLTHLDSSLASATLCYFVESPSPSSICEPSLPTITAG